jgi:hypothetical protein
MTEKEVTDHTTVEDTTVMEETDPVTEEVTDTAVTITLEVVGVTEEKEVTVAVVLMKRAEERTVVLVLAVPDDLLYTYSLIKYPTITLK